MASPIGTDLAWRPAAPDDAAVLEPLVHAIGTHDGWPETYSADDLGDELGVPWLRLDTDSTIGFDDAGRPAAFGLVQVRPGDLTALRITTFGGVHPMARGRGIGRALLAWQVGRGRDLAARRRAELGREVPASVWLDVHESAPGPGRLAGRLGFEPVRWFTVMRRPLADRLPGPVVPPGLVLAPWSPRLDEAVRLAHNEAFADHWGFQPWTAESWRRWQTGHRHFRPGWSHVVLDGDDVAGYALSAAYESDWPSLGFPEGWTAKLGVRRPWRGRGLAKALLAASLRAFAGAGMVSAGLDVDSENLTGAVALYERMGYRPARRSATWALPV